MHTDNTDKTTEDTQTRHVHIYKHRQIDNKNIYAGKQTTYMPTDGLASINTHTKTKKTHLNGVCIFLVS